MDIRLSDLTEPDAYLHLPHLNAHDVQLLWHGDFWDVPLNGMLLYQGRKYWFQTTEDLKANESAEVIYLILELSEEQLREEEYWHELFREKVGTHTDYDANGHRNLEALKPRSSWPDFYNAAKRRAKCDFSSNIVIGWL